MMVCRAGGFLDGEGLVGVLLLVVSDPCLRIVAAGAGDGGDGSLLAGRHLYDCLDKVVLLRVRHAADAALLAVLFSVKGNGLAEVVGRDLEVVALGALTHVVGFVLMVPVTHGVIAEGFGVLVAADRAQCAGTAGCRAAVVLLVIRGVAAFVLAVTGMGHAVLDSPFRPVVVRAFCCHGAADDQRQQQSQQCSDYQLLLYGLALPCILLSSAATGSRQRKIFMNNQGNRELQKRALFVT